MNLKAKLFRFWRKKLLPLIFIFVVIHFFKDITQDILKVASPLDFFGDVKEDISFLPRNFQLFFWYGLGGFSIIVEAFLLIAIPKVLKREKFITLEKRVVAGVLYLVIFLTVCIFLDPRYKPRFW